MNAHPRPRPLNLRHGFVAMLFALTAGQIAISAADLVEIWNVGAVGLDFLAPVTHLLLALVIVTTSWVGWSVVTANSEPVEHPFHFPFSVLLLDVFLVVIYFVIALEVEIDPDQKLILYPSASEEIVGVMFIFGVYCFWDVVHDVVIKKQNWFIAVFASAVSLVAAVMVWVAYSCLSSNASVWSVLCADIALLGLVFAFRALKGVEKPLADWIVPKGPPFNKRSFPWKVWVSVSAIVFAVGFVGMFIV